MTEGIFMNYCERTGVWAAFRERSYEGIGFIEEGIVLGLKPRQMFEDTTKFADVQEKSHQNAIFLV